jgi:hypothetical protein
MSHGRHWSPGQALLSGVPPAAAKKFDAIRYIVQLVTDAGGATRRRSRDSSICRGAIYA